MVNTNDVIVIIVVILVTVTVADSVSDVDVDYQKIEMFSFTFKIFKNCVRFKSQLSGKKSKKKFARHKIRSDSPDKDVFAFDLEDPGETQVPFYEKLA